MGQIHLIKLRLDIIPWLFDLIYSLVRRETFIANSRRSDTNNIVIIKIIMIIIRCYSIITISFITPADYCSAHNNYFNLLYGT